MSDYQQRVTDSFNERKRLIRLRRRKENLRFWQEFGIIPRWLIILVIVLFLAAQAIAFLVNMSAPQRGDQIFPPELRDNPALASLALAGIVTAASLCMAVMIFMIAYVNHDASRRGMSAALWTILVLILLPAWGFIGFVIYFLMRAPLPTPPPLVSTFPNVERLVGLRPILVVPLQPLPPHQFGWLMKLYASARNCSPVFSVIGKDLNNPRFQFWNPGW